MASLYTQTAMVSTKPFISSDKQRKFTGEKFQKNKRPLKKKLSNLRKKRKTQIEVYKFN
jgi:hypothetical protein